MVCVISMEFLPLSHRRSSMRNVPIGEERGETDVFAGYTNLYSSFSTLYSSALWRTDTIISTKLNKPPVSIRPFLKWVWNNKPRRGVYFVVGLVQANKFLQGFVGSHHSITVLSQPICTKRLIFGKGNMPSNFYFYSFLWQI